MKNRNLLIFLTFMFMFFFILPDTALAQAAPTEKNGIDKLFTNIGGSLGAVANFIISMAAIAGLGFGVASVFKFKQHKDNPQQVPLGQPLGLLAISVMLLWLPFLLQSLGSTLTGGDSKTGKSGISNSTTAPDWLQGSGGGN